MGYLRAATVEELEELRESRPIGSFARVGDVFFCRRAITGQWEELDGVPSFFADSVAREAEGEELWDDDDEPWDEDDEEWTESETKPAEDELAWDDL